MKKGLLRALIIKYSRLIIAMILVMSLGCGLMAGMSNGFLSLKETLDFYIRDSEYPDAVIDNFYSDSFADAPLAEIAQKAFMVKKDQILPWPEE